MSSEKFNDLKKEIRSILISFQKGCYLSEFNKTYKNLIGRRLPISEFAFKTEVELLKAMPDVVRVNNSSVGDPHLMGIADESTKHVQNMVLRQKPAKLKPPSRSMTRFSRAHSHYAPPPRMVAKQKTWTDYQPKSTYFSNKVTSSFEFSNEKKNPFIPNPKSETSNNVPTSNRATNTPSEIPNQNPLVEVKSTSAKDEVVSLVKYYKNGIPLEEILYEYEQMYNKSLSLSDYGFSSIDECIENIAELDILDIDDIPFAVHESEASRLCNTVSSSSNDNNRNPVQNSVNYEEIPDRPNSTNDNLTNGNLSSEMISLLKQVANKFSWIIWSSEFPRYFEEVTHTALDLHKLGYNCLADFIDDIPEIFRRKYIAGNKRDYVIYPASLDLNAVNGNCATPLLGALLIEEVIVNLRQILQANLEGIKLKHLEHIYKINCKGGLHASNFGYRDLETFLHSIKDQVPLRCKIQNGEKIVCLVKLSGDMDIELPYSSPYVCQEGPIPADAVSPKFVLKPLIFSNESNYTTYFPVYVSSVINPGHFYIQLQEEETTKAYEKMGDNIEDFYNGEQSLLYRMNSAHIQVGASCIALWPADQHWYRAQILKIPSMEKVQVNYVDYGTRDEIPTSLLRYMKKQYTVLPIQSLRCCLSYLKPAKNAAVWSVESRNKLLKMCKDIPLMAKIEEKQPDGVYSIVLCDTNGDKDVYINDNLISEGYAECGIGEPTSVQVVAESIPCAIPSPVPAVNYSNINPIQAMQGHQYLLLFASVLPSFSVNEHYLKLLQQVSTMCSSNLSNPQNMALHNLASASLNPYSSRLNACTNHAFSSAHPLSSNNSSVYSTPLASLGSVPALSSTDLSQDAPIRSPTPLDAEILGKSSAFPAENNKDDECEIFVDEDDDIFEKFCQQVAFKTRRYVKRVLFGDGYKIHIINFKDKAYASNGDISQLIWNNKDPDYMLRRLQHKEVELPSLTLHEESHEELFKQLDRFKVKGIQRTSESVASIILYPLKEVVKILNVFGHPSALLRTKIIEETAKFDCTDPMWKDYSVLDLPEYENDSYVAATDDDKIKRLCLYDLQAMKEGISYKRLSIMSQLNKDDTSKHVDEINKLEQMQRKVLQRIEEIKEICSSFS